MAKPTDNEISDLKWLLDRLKIAEDYCRPYFEKAQRYYKLYRFASSVREADWPYVNRVRSRDILAFVEDTTALMVQTLFATMPFFSMIPRETSLLKVNYENIDPLLIGDQLEKCVDYQVSHEGTEFFEEMVDFFKGGAMLGNSYEGVYPKFTTNGDYLRPLLRTSDFWDVLPIPGPSRLSRSRGVFIREFTTIEDLMGEQDKGVYRNVQNIKSIEGSGSDPEKNWHKTLLQQVGFADYEPEKNEIEIFHYFSGGHIISFADRKVILRDSRKKERGEIIKPYPYDMPVVQYKYMPIPLEFFAMGIPEVLEVLQEDKNLIRSARRDNIDHVINKIVKARLNADINFDLIKYYPGAIWPLQNLSDIEVLDTGDVTQSSYHEEGLIQNDMENALSFFGYARGQTPAHSEQPTTVMKLQQASLNRLDLAVKMAEFTTLQNIASRIILLTRRFMSQGDYESIVGAKDAGFYRLTEEDIRRFWYVKPVGSSITHIKEIRQQQIGFALEILGKIPPQMAQENKTPFTVDWYEALKTALDSVDIKNVERILVKLKQEQPGIPQGGMPMMPGMDEIMGLAGVSYGGGQ